MNVVLALIATIALLGFIVLTALVSMRVNGNNVKALVLVGITWILLVMLSVLAQYYLYTLKPSFYDWNALKDWHTDDAHTPWPLLVDVLLGCWSIWVVIDYVEKLAG